MITFQEILKRLSSFWEAQGCIIHQGYDLEVGAGTFNPATFLRCLGPEPYNAAYIEPCRRPSDGRYGTNPNRLQHYFQYQVILKPSPSNILDLYLQSLEAIGFNLQEHDMRFVHDDWESPSLGAWGLGWEVWMDGMEVTQFTYFQAVGGQPLKPITGEITYGIERLAMYLQRVSSIFDLQWNEKLTYGDIYHRNEVEWSHYNFEQSSQEMWFRHFEDYEKEAKRLMDLKLPIPAYDFVMKASHAFNMLDARGAISVTERTGYIARIRELSRRIAESYVESRKELGYPLLKYLTESEKKTPVILKVPELSATEDFLLEIGLEELPATFVEIGIEQLEKAFKAFFKEHNLVYQSLHAMGTPRRLALLVKDLQTQSSEQRQERKGPPLDAVFDEKEQLTEIGKGFLRSLGIDSISKKEIVENKHSQLKSKAIKGTAYLFAELTSPSKSTYQILRDALPNLILKLEFPKKMRWGSSEVSFARPISWLLALLGKSSIPFQLEEILSGEQSEKGHYPYNQKIAIEHPSVYISELRKNKIMVDQEERKASILEQLDTIAKRHQAKPIFVNTVAKEVVNLVEWPYLTESTFDVAFLKAPKEALTMPMVHHQKYFPLENSSGSLLNIFVITANTEPTDYIREGNQKVLSARLSDGVFLYNQGLKQKLESYNDRLKEVIYQKALGSVYNKVERIIKHAESLHKLLPLANLSQLQKAALLCKADLATEMVYEFPELQGTIGEYYALAQGEEKEVAQAIREHWMPVGENAPLPSSEIGTMLSIVEKIDNLLGCYMVGLKPTSSSDPYALRRQSLGIVKMLIEGKLSLDLRNFLEQCAKHFTDNLKVDVSEIMQFIENRLRTYLQDKGYKKEEIEATLINGWTSPYDVFLKVDALHHFRKNAEALQPLMEVYKRAKGQLKHATDEANFAPAQLQEPSEKTLYGLLNDTEGEYKKAIELGHYQKTLEMLSALQPPLSSLFEEVKILADDKAIRDTRLGLLAKVQRRFDAVYDFSLL